MVTASRSATSSSSNIDSTAAGSVGRTTAANNSETRRGKPNATVPATPRSTIARGNPKTARTPTRLAFFCSSWTSSVVVPSKMMVGRKTVKMSSEDSSRSNESPSADTTTPMNTRTLANASRSRPRTSSRTTNPRADTPRTPVNTDVSPLTGSV